MKRVLIYFIYIFIVISSVFAQDTERPSREHEVYFRNTQNELNVFKLYGRFDGKTALILGGIQGDEPGGFLSADLYPNLVLEKGNLIVIPRANFHSIIKNQREINGDMNRRFGDHPADDEENKIVKIIKELMGEADLFLNLHDGWGFYSHTYENSGRNPSRFGQSIIADDSIYIANNDTIQLKQMACSVLEKVNQKIDNPKHQMKFMNTNTFSDSSNFKEMESSATYFALTEYNIPAFGVEASKNLENIEQKIRYHNYVINEFLTMLGIEPEHPAIIYEPAKLVYIAISINDAEQKIVSNKNVLQLHSGDKIRITHIESNYQRGLSVDVENVGDVQDFNKSISILKPTKLIVRKDNVIIGEIGVNISKIDAKMMVYIFQVNGEKKALLDGQQLSLKRGDKFRILNVSLEGINSSELEVNLKGFVPPGDFNTGEDRNHLVNTSDLSWNKYSVYGKGRVYPIVVSNGALEISRVLISISD